MIDRKIFEWKQSDHPGELPPADIIRLLWEDWETVRSFLDVDKLLDVWDPIIVQTQGFK